MTRYLGQPPSARVRRAIGALLVAAEASPKDLELVADEGGSIVGHVLAAVGDVDGGPMIGIAPLSVRPERQGQGIGSALMQELLRRVEAAGWPVALLLGSPQYYSRFGFRPAAELGITYGADACPWPPPGYFGVNTLLGS